MNQWARIVKTLRRWSTHKRTSQHIPFRMGVCDLRPPPVGTKVEATRVAAIRVVVTRAAAMATAVVATVAAATAVRRVKSNESFGHFTKRLKRLEIVPETSMKIVDPKDF